MTNIHWVHTIPSRKPCSLCKANRISIRAALNRKDNSIDDISLVY